MYCQNGGLMLCISQDFGNYFHNGGLMLSISQDSGKYCQNRGLCLVSVKTLVSLT